MLQTIGMYSLIYLSLAILGYTWKNKKKKTSISDSFEFGVDMRWQNSM